MGSGFLSPGHLAIVLLVVLLVFGPKRLPELGRALGGGMRSFKDSINGEDGDQAQALQSAEVAEQPPRDPPAPPASSTPAPPA